MVHIQLERLKTEETITNCKKFSYHVSVLKSLSQ
jgi:hypothetical protein